MLINLEFEHDSQSKIDLDLVGSSVAWYCAAFIIGTVLFKFAAPH